MKTLIIKCKCSGECGEELKVLDYNDDDCEINGIYLDKKAIEKLIKYLSKII